ncbi:hypothetical protein B0H14DRAFT_3867847 [Mycena olivaceomarginata]|nr:hypothetical protein B0H14DRAFT_3867847 [Mycena olivaceomarginata]
MHMHSVPRISRPSHLPGPSPPAPSMDRVRALSRLFGTALGAPALPHLTFADIHGHALVMFLSVIRGATFPHLSRLTLVTIDTAGINGRVICAFTAGVTELVLARLDPAPLFRRLSVPTVWPTPRRHAILVLARPGTEAYSAAFTSISTPIVAAVGSAIEAAGYAILRLGAFPGGDIVFGVLANIIGVAVLKRAHYDTHLLLDPTHAARVGAMAA